MPLGWDELGPAIGAAYFTVANAPSRLASLARDPWEAFRAAAAPIDAPKARSGRRREPYRFGPAGDFFDFASAATLLRKASMMLITLLGGVSGLAFALARFGAPSSSR